MLSPLRVRRGGRWAFFLIVFAVLAMPVAASAQQQDPYSGGTVGPGTEVCVSPHTQKVTLSSYDTEIGDHITATASGYNPTKPVTFYLDGSAFAVVDADAGGSASTPLTVPHGPTFEVCVTGPACAPACADPGRVRTAGTEGNGGTGGGGTGGGGTGGGGPTGGGTTGGGTAGGGTTGGGSSTGGASNGVLDRVLGNVLGNDNGSGSRGFARTGINSLILALLGAVMILTGRRMTRQSRRRHRRKGTPAV